MTSLALAIEDEEGRYDPWLPFCSLNEAFLLKDKNKGARKFRYLVQFTSRFGIVCHAEMKKFPIQ